MNSIKLRVWSGEHWYTGEESLKYLCFKNPDETNVEMTFIGSSRIISLSTGLKDKNDQEIYEGDILQVDSADGRPYNKEVQWETGYMIGTGFGINLSYAERSKVIGNIYENPELLNEPRK